MSQLVIMRRPGPCYTCLGTHRQTGILDTYMYRYLVPQQGHVHLCEHAAWPTGLSTSVYMLPNVTSAHCPPCP